MFGGKKLMGFMGVTPSTPSPPGPKSDPRLPPMPEGTVSTSLPLIADLIRGNARAIATVRSHPSLIGVLRPEHDELFILRYVLSAKGDLARAAGAIKAGIAWREKHASLLARVDDLQEEVRAAIATGMLPWRNDKGRPIQLTVPFAVPSDQWANKSEQWHFEAGISNREVAYRICDRLTRESGRLVKLVLIQDVSALTMSFVLRSSKLVNNQGKLSKLSEFLYPQLIETIIITHPPSFLSVLHRMANAVMSPRVMEKFRVAGDAKRLAELADLRMEKIPRCLGGLNDFDAPWVPIDHDGNVKQALTRRNTRRLSFRGKPRH
mmetsp:Transcript_9208/g.26773  ORF Transcript_9208/g.26773 Transcript_9208/m.26773 type:complete len:321 (-) Transcript_9208:483-1445(-)